ncbi:hypothetical protein [Methylophaga nitratireducenticrescens]|uniref:hypothetical protein n=1 Tax=Methylophaga nitratireducenticrescens TaxID=754476 RepID=UPI00146D83B3|nr:hypothetical protein [Methylophaga nitratireducenticrescens]
MRNYHQPDNEKRMLCFLHDDEYEAWLSAPANESREFLRQSPSELMTISSN